MKHIFGADVNFNKNNLSNVKLEESLSLPVVTASDAGLVVFNSSQNSFYGWDGSTWVNFGGGAPGGYKVYTALLTQAGTAAPVSIVLENTLGATPVFSRLSSGDYRITLTSAFTNNKVALFISNAYAGFSFTSARRLGVSELQIETRSASDNLSSDDKLAKTTFEIRIYN
tara:strand:- start:1930 stop:2439 length:510 start_codon:yes stop_codon:yes gene_type:complete